ncbi:addiction module protein [Undibacterium danionis]|uniref:Addiction module protein n=1 Tax=Undibacterium danionis TaxID=1812100 RepID=A0ABV6IJG7_9BURK
MSTLLGKIKQLDIAERIQLVEDLWDSVATRSSDFPITEAQKTELDRRLAKRASAKPVGISLDQIAQKLGVSI